MPLVGPSLFAVATGIVGSGWLSGTIGMFSIVGIPTALDVSQSTLAIWHSLFTRGMATMPKIAVTVGLAYGYAAYDSYGRGENWKGYLSAAGLVVSIVPFTLAFMAPTNSILIDAVKSSASTLSHTRLTELVQKWAVLNFIRSSLPLLGAITGFATFLSNGI